MLATRPFKAGLLVTLDAVTDRTEAERWNDRHLLVPVEELTQPEDGEVFLHELAGMSVHDESGAPLGEVRGWFPVPHGVLLDVHTKRGDVALPFNEQFVREVNRTGRTITVAIPDELFSGGSGERVLTIRVASRSSPISLPVRSASRSPRVPPRPAS